MDREKVRIQSRRSRLRKVDYRDGLKKNGSMYVREKHVGERLSFREESIPIAVQVCV